MKINLILPPNPVLQSPLMEAPLGPLYLASVLKENGHDVSVTDMRADREPNMSLIPDGCEIYGVTATTAEYNDARNISTFLNKKNPESLLVIGGAHVTYDWKSTLENTMFQVAVIGEGEITISELADATDMFGIKGIAFKTGESRQRPRIHKNTPRPLIEDLDSIPFPDREVLPYDKIFTTDLYYGARYGHGEVATSVITERGCPYYCSYCANWDRTLRFRSVENVVKEIEVCKENYNCHKFRFIDDEWGIGQPRSMDLLEALAGLDIHFRAHTRSDVVDLELLQAMKKAGCDEISFGVETADDEVLTLLNKRETVEQHKQAVMFAKEAGLLVKVYLMTCLPGETWQTVDKIKAFIEETRPDKWTLSTFIPYPGCDVWKNPERYGVKILEKDFDKYWLYNEQSIIETNVASKEELDQHRAELWRFLNEYDASKQL
ncbi:MAG TPA: radical SAM protein [Candidatus Lokiarchaeia archaeon]|nr:radical SAM protein [Candidatus Lokiarchaeia archaeon]